MLAEFCESGSPAENHQKGSREGSARRGRNAQPADPQQFLVQVSVQRLTGVEVHGVHHHQPQRLLAAQGGIALWRLHLCLRRTLSSSGTSTQTPPRKLRTTYAASPHFVSAGHSPDVPTPSLDGLPPHLRLVQLRNWTVTDNGSVSGTHQR